MKKILCLILFLFVFFVPFGNNSVYADTPSQIRIIVNNANLYENANISSTVLTTIPHKTILGVLEGINNNEFYKVTYQSQTGYILATHTMDTVFASPKRKLDFNAKIKNDTFAHSLSNTTYSPTIIELAKNTEIRIIDGFVASKEYHLCSFYYEDTISTLYIKTADLEVYGISRTAIMAISIIISCACLILVLFGFKGKKTKSVVKNIKKSK